MNEVKLTKVRFEVKGFVDKGISLCRIKWFQSSSVEFG